MQKVPALLIALAGIPEFRKPCLVRHPLPLCLIVILLGFMSGHLGYRALGDFLQRHHAELCRLLQVESEKLPTFFTLRRVIQQIDTQQFSNCFFAWATTLVPMEKDEWLAFDGKAIKGTVRDFDAKTQNFISLVSFFQTRLCLTLSTQELENKKSSEIPNLRHLLEQMGISACVIQADALHTQKNNSHDSGNRE